MDGNSGSATGVRNRRETMVILDEVTNNGSAMGIRKRGQTMTILDERSQTQSTLVIT